MGAHPFPLPCGPEASWNARQWQAAANHYHYEAMGVDREEPNYRPLLSMMEAARNHATRRAAALRASEAL